MCNLGLTNFTLRYYHTTTIFLDVLSAREDAKCADNSRQIRGEATSSKTYSETSERYGKHRKRHIDHLRDQSKLTRPIHCLGH